MATHRTHRRPSAVTVAGAAAGLTAVLTFGQITDAIAATLPGNDAVVAIGGAQNPTSDRVDDKFGGEYVPYNGEFVGVEDDRYFGVAYPAEVPVDDSVAEGRAPLIATMTSTRDTVGPAGTIYIVSYSEGTIVAEKYKRELSAETVPDPGAVQFVYIAAPTVPNGGIYARFPNLRLPGFTSTGAAAPSPYDETFITIEYDPVGDFPAYANPLSLANAAAGFFYLHGDPTPDAANLNTDAILVHTVEKPGEGTDTYILVRTEHLPLLQPFRDMSTALNTVAFTEPVLGAIEPTLKLVVDMGYTDRDYSQADTPTRFSLITPPKRIVETIQQLPDALQQGADNVTGGLPSTTSESEVPNSDKTDVDKQTVTRERTPKAVEPTDARDVAKRPTKRAPTQRRDEVRSTVSDLAKNVRDSFKPKPKRERETKPESATSEAA
ncbi:PE-PPE domain-containing protein [Mycolicibacterium sp. HK-90]|uniref:PE-PPE domain-containing protein n=1 Tax=Mycolicibacterium sp. HK-90 TaxID=3056937 RepID=UPI002658DF4D|nr:PE-PPE domain-containing protein [Mycolicibacterium sp. HK-90]WKG03209.1 PE-PPE domain-containing protein [Mycolicibacterium sp. HK-90]